MSTFFGVLSLVSVGLAVLSAVRHDMEAARFDAILGILFAIQMKLWS